MKGRIDRSIGLASLLRRVREEERAVLAQELHDELGALLMAAKLDVAGLRARCGPLSTDVEHRFQHLAQLLSDGVALKTRIVEGLQPAGLAQLGLVAALRNLARDFASNTDIAVTTRLHDCRLDEPAQLSVYRLVQECLTNIGKHAHATEVTIDLLDGPAGAVVAITDNGVGFDQGRVAPLTHGLAGMHQRVQRLGGSVTVTSSPGAGTRVVALLPVMAPLHGVVSGIHVTKRLATLRSARARERR